jgi:hypothetical protein
MTFDPFTFAGIAGAALLVAAYFARTKSTGLNPKISDTRSPICSARC